MAWKLNGARIENNPRKLPAVVLEMLPDFKFWSVEALQELYYGIMELSLEMAKQERRDRKGGERATITRYINQINRSKYKIPSNRGKLLKALYEKILIAKGCGRLHGFGFTTKWGDALKGNSEYEFITIIPKQQNRMEESIMKRSELVKAAKELNETLGLEPQINIKEKSKALADLIKEAAELVDPELDDLTDNTLSVIAKITKDEKTTKKEEISEKEESKESAIVGKTVKVAARKKNVNEKNTDKKSIPKKRKFGEKTLFLLSLIEEGRFTRKEIIEKTLKKFPSASKSSLGTFLTDSKNPKYNKFDSLVKQGKNGILSF